MIDDSPEIINSIFSRKVTHQGVTVEVCIYRSENDQDWILEVVNPTDTSIVWDDQFPSDIEANAEFERTLKKDGIHSFLDGAENVVPFRPR